MIHNSASIVDAPKDEGEDTCDVHKERAEELSEGTLEGGDEVKDTAQQELRGLRNLDRDASEAKAVQCICGSHSTCAWVSAWPGRGGGNQLQCNGCGLRGPFHPTGDGATYAWNDRIRFAKKLIAYLVAEHGVSDSEGTLAEVGE